MLPDLLPDVSLNRSSIINRRPRKKFEGELSRGSKSSLSLPNSRVYDNYGARVALYVDTVQYNTV
jgi:hypothetical protein